MTHTVRFSIKDYEGHHYFNDFVFDMEESDPDVIEREFARRVRKAVADWFVKDKAGLVYEIEMYGYGYEYDDDDGDELEYAIDNFPAASVAHIPDKIMEANGFRLRERPDVELTFYGYGGFLNDYRTGDKDK